MSREPYWEIHVHNPLPEDVLDPILDTLYEKTRCLVGSGTKDQWHFLVKCTKAKSRRMVKMFEEITGSDCHSVFYDHLA